MTRKRLAILLAVFVAASFVLGACGPSDQQEAAEDCLVYENKAACKYVDELRAQQQTSNEIQDLEDQIAGLQEKIEILKEKLKTNEEKLQLLKEAWLASKTGGGDN